MPESPYFKTGQMNDSQGMNHMKSRYDSKHAMINNNNIEDSPPLIPQSYSKQKKGLN